MSGIFYDPTGRRLHVVTGTPEPHWTFVTHDTRARVHHCRRIMREWLGPEDLFRVDFSAVGVQASA
ncbi:MAG: hypothetical protein WEC33_00920 [Dehalococcoidia bacterium]